MGKERKGYRIPKDSIPCKFAKHFNDRVPVPFGKGDCDMPGFECEYDGENLVIPDDMVCFEDSRCPAYEQVKTTICPIHDEEYFDWCSGCDSNGEVINNG